MTSFLQVKRVKSYPGSLSEVPLLCECAERAMHYICNLAAWQEPREDAQWSGLAVPFLCACCVWSRCLGLTEHTRQQMPNQATTFSAALSLLLHQHLWCCHSVCLLCLCVVPCFSFTLIFSWGNTEVWQEKGKLPPVCWMSNVLVILPLQHGRLGCWGVTEFFLSISICRLAPWAAFAEVLLADSVPTCHALCNLLGFASYHRN